MLAQNQQVVIQVRLSGESSIEEIRAEGDRTSMFPFEPPSRGMILVSSVIHPLY